MSTFFFSCSAQLVRLPLAAAAAAAATAASNRFATVTLLRTKLRIRGCGVQITSFLATKSSFGRRKRAHWRHKQRTKMVVLLKHKAPLLPLVPCYFSVFIHYFFSSN